MDVQLNTRNASVKTAYEANANTNAFTDTEKTKLAGISSGAQVNSVTSVAGKTGAVSLAKGDVGLSNVDNTSDADKPVSTAQASAIGDKVSSDPSGITGATEISNIVAISQEDYDALSPEIQGANTFLIPVEE